MGCLLPSLVTSQSMVMIGNKSLVCAQSNVTNKIVFNFMIGGGLDAANDVVYNKMIELAVIFYILFSLLYSKYLVGFSKNSNGIFSLLGRARSENRSDYNRGRQSNN